MVTKDDMMKMFKKMVKESAAERARDIILSQVRILLMMLCYGDLVTVTYPWTKKQVYGESKRLLDLVTL